MWDTSPEGTIFSSSEQLQAKLVEQGERGAVRLLFRGTGPGGVLAHAETLGQVPLPPYIEAARRRTRRRGAIAVDDRAPLPDGLRARARRGRRADRRPALHRPSCSTSCERAGHELAALTLHVGPGTFRPVEVDDPREHHLDPEHYEIPERRPPRVNRARAEGRPVVAVGTTVVRTLEALAARRASCAPGAGEHRALTSCPGDRFRVVTDLVTNFHLPRSTLLMLVAAFAGREPVLAAYREAIARGYRFYSYGDAMFIRRRRGAPRERA